MVAVGSVIPIGLTSTLVTVDEVIAGRVMMTRAVGTVVNVHFTISTYNRPSE